jgi:hypothetical protein
LRQAKQTTQPLPANSVAAARPIPELPPVTTTTFAIVSPLLTAIHMPYRMPYLAHGDTSLR